MRRRQERRGEVDFEQHGVPRVSGASKFDRSEKAKEKERKQIENYLELESDVNERVRLRTDAEDKKGVH